MYVGRPSVGLNLSPIGLRKGPEDICVVRANALQARKMLRTGRSMTCVRGFLAADCMAHSDRWLQCV